MIRQSRLAGIFSAVAPRYIVAFPNRIFPGSLPQLQRGIRNRGPWASLIGIEDYRRRTAAVGSSHYPLAYMEGMRDPRFTKPPARDPNA
jgi:hypothetical protein